MAVPRKILLGLVLVALSSSFLPHGSQAALIHRYSFTTDTTDAVGGANATLHNGATVSLGKLVLDGINDYADLPIGSDVATLENFTVEAWVTRDQQGQWARVFDFGMSRDTSMFLSPQSNLGDPMFGIWINQSQKKTLPPTNISISGAGTPFPVGTETHIAVSIDHSMNFAALYINGVLFMSNANVSLRGVDLGSTVHNYLGRSQYPQDPYFKGSIDELRIYNEALTPLQVLRSCKRGPNNDQSETDVPDLVIPATADLFGAGHPSLPSPVAGGSGTRPVLIRLGGECNSVVTFSSITGSAKPGANPPFVWNDPDGQLNNGTAIDSLKGIAGILHSRQMFLAGLFLDDSEPMYPAPAPMDFRPAGSDQLNDYYPGLRQIFFIGDGLTQALNPQSFHVPNGATRLYLGFADAGNFQGAPGWYDDDYGSMSARVSVCGQSIAGVPQSESPEFELLGAHPNPLTGATEIAFILSKPQSVALKIFDVSGQLIRSLTDQFLAAGPHSALWDRRDDRGRRVPAGIYFYSLNTREQRKSLRMVVLE